MKVAEIMTPDPLTINTSDTIEEAETIMAEYNIRHLLVTEGKDLLGIVTDRDIRSFIGGRLLGAPDEREKAMKTTVDAVMTSKPIALSPDDELSEAVELLVEEKIGGIPVIDEEDGLVGILTYVDVLRCFLDRLQEE